jgi:hypothetical protein
MEKKEAYESSNRARGDGEETGITSRGDKSDKFVQEGSLSAGPESVEEHKKLVIPNIVQLFSSSARLHVKVSFLQTNVKKRG